MKKKPTILLFLFFSSFLFLCSSCGLSKKLSFGSKKTIEILHTVQSRVKPEPFSYPLTAKYARLKQVSNNQLVLDGRAVTDHFTKNYCLTDTESESVLKSIVYDSGEDFIELCFEIKDEEFSRVKPSKAIDPGIYPYSSAAGKSKIMTRIELRVRRNNWGVYLATSSSIETIVIEKGSVTIESTDDNRITGNIDVIAELDLIRSDVTDRTTGRVVPGGFFKRGRLVLKGDFDSLMVPNLDSIEQR